MKLLLYILLFHVGTISFAQDPQLFENPWYLQKLIINGENYFPPHNSDVENILLGFSENPYYIETSVCSGIATDINEIDNESFETHGFAIIPIDCTLQETFVFESRYFNDFFHWQVPHTFGYVVEPRTNNTKVLTLTNQENNQAIYGDEALNVQYIEEVHFSLYPNPVKNDLIIATSNARSQNLTLKIFNIEGKLLSAQNVELTNQASINVSQLKSGIYFLNIEEENGNTAIKKFIKE